MARLFSKIYTIYERIVLCKGNKTAFLRRRGVQIGKNCLILTATENFHLGSEPYLIFIGDNVILSRDVDMITHDGSGSLFRDIEGRCRYGNRFAPITIKDRCFIGTKSLILPGVTIGPDSVVGAGSVVTKDVPPGMVAAGVPARVICTIEEYKAKHITRMVPLTATTREELRKELTLHFFGEER